MGGVHIPWAMTTRRLGTYVTAHGAGSGTITPTHGIRKTIVGSTRSMVLVLSMRR